MVKPYLEDIRYMFPTNLEDVDQMCREERKLLFQKSVENSVDTVHAICSSQHYQREYLSNAVCFKRISIDNCGQYYKQLVAHVSNPRAHDDHICCSYGKFKNCVNDPLLRECGRRARGLMDHSMGFLVSRCPQTNFVINRCPNPMPTTTVTYEITEESFNQQNDLSDNRARADRSFDTEMAEESTISWTPYTIAYTLPPESESQTSGSFSLQ
ncbi:uncharacterized protein LOC128964762 [Oppia nitens]|uniref:uncharacterized protein LOC128964762 n=1 Tax=Oppia nitens TaxID=1686743 RepID=UPI0023DCC4A4|nr:uncharacterized protein LOC128964762 [Oppia nitens]